MGFFYTLAVFFILSDHRVKLAVGGCILGLFVLFRCWFWPVLVLYGHFGPIYRSNRRLYLAFPY